MTRALTVLLILFLSFQGYTQNDTISSQKKGFIFESSSRNMNFSSLNELLSISGFPRIDNNVIGFSLGRTYRFSDMNSYGSGVITFLETESSNSEGDSKSAVIRMLELAAEMHWVVSKSPKWFIYPYYGFGISASKLKLTEKITNLTFEESISDLSANKENSREYYSEYPLLFANLGIGIDRKIKISSIDYYLGLSLGYRLSTKSNWGYAGSPSINYNGFEFKLKVRFEINNENLKHYKPKYYKYFN